MRTGFLLDDRKPLRLKDEDVVKWFRHQTLAHFTNNCFDADHSFHGTSSIAKCLTMTIIAPYPKTHLSSTSISPQLIVLSTKTEGKPTVPVVHEHAKHHSSLKGMLQYRGACIVSAVCQGETQRCRIVIIGGIRLFFTKRMCMLFLLHYTQITAS